MLVRFIPPRSLPVTLGTVLVGVSLLATRLGVGTRSRAEAAAGCRSDQIVVLSDGIVLDLSATIADPVSDVRQITYILHVPDGAVVIRVISTDGVVGYKEKSQVKSDSAPDTYTTEVRVKTGTKGVSMFATVAGGYASQVGITPAMVGLSSFAWTSTTSVRTKGPGATRRLFVDCRACLLFATPRPGCREAGASRHPVSWRSPPTSRPLRTRAMLSFLRDSQSR